MYVLGKTSTGKKRFLSGIARIRGEGVYPCPDFLAPFFYQVLVLKIAFFYSNFTVIVCFFSHFCHNYHQNYHNYHHNYHCNLHYQHRNFFRSYAQNVVFDVKKRGPSCPNWGQGGVFRWFGQCPKENVFFSLRPSLSQMFAAKIFEISEHILKLSLGSI